MHAWSAHAPWGRSLWWSCQPMAYTFGVDFQLCLQNDSHVQLQESPQNAPCACQQRLSSRVALRSCLHDHVPDKNVDLVRPTYAASCLCTGCSFHRVSYVQGCCGGRL